MGEGVGGGRGDGRDVVTMLNTTVITLTLVPSPPLAICKPLCHEVFRLLFLKPLSWHMQISMAYGNIFLHEV